MDGFVFDSKVLEAMPDMIAMRRSLHQHPELSFEEFQTTDYIARILGAVPGLRIERPAKTGLIAVLKGLAGEGRKTLLRADIDALPITEENDLPFRSENPGVMHACGHDGHTAMLLAAAKILAAERERLTGEVHFLFQHAEELPPGGAAELYELGIMDGIDELYGMHVSSNYPTGKFGVRAGALTSATDRFDVKIIGKGGHSAFPETCVDPMVIAGEVITAFQTIVSRRIRAVEPAVVSICEIHGGSAYNIIPGEVTLTGSTRTFSEETRKALPEVMEQIVRGLCDAAGATYEFSFSKGYASVINDREMTDLGQALIEKRFGKEAVLPIDPLMPGEDYSALQKNCPGFFVELGARSEEKGITAPHHNKNYLLDEDALLYGLQYWVDLVRSRHASDIAP